MPCDSIVDYILLKIAARCNIACDYCYWFRDPSVYSKPKVMSADTLSILVERIVEHVNEYGLKRFSILFHGGEPMLCPPAVIKSFCTSLHHRAPACSFKFSITTNGLLLTEEWIDLFREWKIAVTISIDGPKELHDAHRVDFKGHGTFDRVIDSISLLRKNLIEPGILSVCNPSLSPSNLFHLLVDELGFMGFDVLIPDATHLIRPQSISNFYKELFDIWLECYDSRGVTVRIIDNILLGLLGGYSTAESIGYGPVRRLTILTDGDMETLDVLRIVGNNFTKSELNIRKNRLQEIESDPLWREVLNSSLNLPEICASCVYKTACGGGHIVSRWSNDRRFDNPSVYCDDLKSVFRHVWSKISPDLILVPGQTHAFAGGKHGVSV